MKKSKQISIRPFLKYSFILGFLFLITSCNDKPNEVKKETVEVEEVNTFKDILWNVVAIQKDGKSMEIKAIDPNGNTLDVKAFQNSNQDSFMNVKAIDGDNNLPIKVIVSKDRFSPVKAIVKS